MELLRGRYYLRNIKDQQDTEEIGIKVNNNEKDDLDNLTSDEAQTTLEIFTILIEFFNDPTIEEDINSLEQCLHYQVFPYF